MVKVILAFLIIAIAGISAGETVQGTSSRGGLSGFLLLPGTDVLQRGGLRIQGRFDYIDVRDSSGNYLVLPISVTWGWMEGFEVGGEIPFYLDDSADGGKILGDITAGCSWLYETARGGSALVLRGKLRFPTGQEGRDRGSELDLGISTSTTFRLFRLQASASYVVSGGRNPFEDSISDYLNFSMGGASFVSKDVQVVCGMDGNTCGSLGLSGSGVFYIFDSISLFGVLRAGLSGSESYSVSAGASWTGTGF